LQNLHTLKVQIAAGNLDGCQGNITMQMGENSAFPFPFKSADFIQLQGRLPQATLVVVKAI